MAALSFTYVGSDPSKPEAPSVPQSLLREVTVQVTPGNGATDEWLDLSKVIRSIKSVVGHAQVAGTAIAPLFKLNSLGTAGSASEGKLAIQVGGATTTFQITVRGLAR